MPREPVEHAHRHPGHAAAVLAVAAAGTMYVAGREAYEQGTQSGDLTQALDWALKVSVAGHKNVRIHGTGNFGRDEMCRVDGIGITAQRLEDHRHGICTGEALPVKARRHLRQR